MSFIKNLSWETIGKVVLGLLGVVPALLLLINFINSRSPQITVTNQLAYPIKIYTSGDYRGILQPNASKTFSFYSEKVFPVKVKWEGIKQKTSSGDPTGDLVTGIIEYVDNHKTVVIDYMTGENDYFMPVITNHTGKTCEIYVNDKLQNYQYAGVLLPHKERVNPGYFEWRGNSNVTLYCEDGPHWFGDREGVEGPPLNVQSPTGITELNFR